MQAKTRRGSEAWKRWGAAGLLMAGLSVSNISCSGDSDGDGDGSVDQTGGAVGSGAATGSGGAAQTGGDTGSGGDRVAPPVDVPTGTAATDADLGPNVLIFDAASQSMAEIQAQVDAVSAQAVPRDIAEFADHRYGLLFKPGAYDLDVQVGYYMQVMGVGQSPDDVVISGQVRSNNTTNSCLTCFWRAVENLAIQPSGGTNVWGVSQAAPMRRTHVMGNLNLHDSGGSTSGGFLADSVVDGTINSGSQQQFFTRNTRMGSWNGGVWNMVFVGVENPPAGGFQLAIPRYTTIPTTPRVREKPYLFLDMDGTYSVMVPDLRDDTLGPTWVDGVTPGTVVSTSQFYIVREDTDDAASINAALAEGWNLLITPGVYNLDDTLRVTRPETIVLGIGLPSLVANNGGAAMSVSDVPGVKLAGFMFEAGPTESPTLLEVGEADSATDHSANPTTLHDLFCRVGGAIIGTAQSCVTINSHDVIADHFWLWRADHGEGAGGMRPGWDSLQSASGLIVNGDDVTIYGLFVEHFQGYQTLWNGNGGRVYFYQSEIPYDPPSNEIWSVDGGVTPGIPSYKVADTVTTHEAWGLGMYSNFLAPGITMTNAAESPTAPGVVLQNLSTRWLNNNGGILNILNGMGDEVNSGSPDAVL